MGRDLLLTILGGGLVVLPLLACPPASAGEFDLPAFMKNTPGASVHGVITFSAEPPFRVLSWSKLNATGSQSEHKWTAKDLKTFTYMVSKGRSGDWRWTVLSGQPLFASWKNWTGLSMVKRYRRSHGSSHPVVDWDQAMVRLRQLANYLLGQAPLPLDATLYLVPQGSGGEIRETITNRHFVPLKFVFWYPGEHHGAIGRLHQHQFAALIKAASNVFYEFQHIELAAGVSRAPSIKQSSLKANTIKDEANSVCWRISAEIVLLKGTHSVIRYRNLKIEPGSPAFIKKWGKKPNYRDAIPWATAIVTRDLRAYLKERRLPETFRVSDQAADDAVLEFCRSLTLHAWDVTSQPVSAKQVVEPAFPETATDR